MDEADTLARALQTDAGATFVLAAATPGLADMAVDEAAAHADCVEFRMDMAAAAGRDPLAALADYDGPLPLLVTNRPAWEGGETDAAERDRLETLRVAAEHPWVGAVDVELAAIAGDGDGARTVSHAREAGAAVVASVHEFDGTPARGEMKRLLERACELGDVGKLAVTAESLDDALRVLGLTRARASAGDRVATMAMGPPGRHTRVVAPVYGSRLGYAPLAAADATAPGQFELPVLRELVDRLMED